jgi:hypothetical protein
MEATKSLKQLRGFIGMDNYYRDMWPHQANVLAPPTAKIGNKKCYLSLPDDLITDNPLDMEHINKTKTPIMHFNSRRKITQIALCDNKLVQV